MILTAVLGSDIRMLSYLAPGVCRPNLVPLSQIRLNSTYLPLLSSCHFLQMNTYIQVHTKSFDNEFRILSVKFPYVYLNFDNLCSTFYIWVTCVVTIVTFLCVSSHHSCASVRLECRTVIQHQHSSRTRKTTLSHLHSNVRHLYIALMG